MPSSPELICRLVGDLPPMAACLVDNPLIRHFYLLVGDGQERISHVNDSFCQGLGSPREAFAGRPLFELLELSPEQRQAWDGARAEGREWRGEVPCRGADGRLLWLELALIPLPVRDGPSSTLVFASDISRLIEAEQQFRRSEAMFRSLAETSSAAIFLLREGKVAYANPALSRLTGYTLAELEGRAVEDLVVPSMREEVVRRHGERLAGKTVPAYPLEFQTKDGASRWVEVAAGRFEQDGAVGVMVTAIDITESRRAEANQRQLRQVMKQMLDGDPVPTLVINKRHEVTYWNQACATATGVKAEEVLGTNQQWRAFYDHDRPLMADLIVDNALDDLDKFYAAGYRCSLMVPGAYEAEGFFPRMGERGTWLMFTAAPLRDEAGRVIGAIETLQDITLRKDAEASLQKAFDELEVLVQARTEQLARAKAELEEDVRRREAAETELKARYGELQALNASLQSAQEQLVQSEKMASIGQLAAGVAHEINNPIGYVQSNLGSLGNYVQDLFHMLDSYETALAALPADHPAVQTLRGVQKEVDLEFLREDVPQLLAESGEGISRVRKIVADLKDFSRVDNNQEWQWANLHQGLDSTLNIVNNEIKYKAEVVKAYGELPEIQCLPSQLNQVFMNLLVNAAHAMSGPRGTITLRTGRDGEHVWVEVADTGSGIPPEVINRIFDPFFTTKPVGKGTGLGLSLSFGIVQKHHGRIDVQSQVGQGTTFRIELPIRQTAPEGSAS